MIKIIYKPLSQIRAYENNPRINDGAIEAVKNSIEEYGFKVPIVIDGGGVIVTGHTRVKAAQALGMEEVPCVVADDLSPEEVRAFRLADNKTGELSEWDFSLLETEIQGIEENLKGFGLVMPETFSFEFEPFDGDILSQPQDYGVVLCPECGGELVEVVE